MLKVYGMATSGNCYKVKLVLEQLHLFYRWVEIDILKGASRTSEFLAMNPNGRVPLLEIEPGTWLPESNAILCYLASGTPLLPEDRLARARVMQWLFFEQYSHEPNIAVARFWVRFLNKEAEYRERLEERRTAGYAALDVMEGHLVDYAYFAGEPYTVADIALYAYTHVAHEGGFDLSGYPAVRAWLARVRAQPDHVTME